MRMPPAGLDAAILLLRRGISIEAHDLHPVRSLACRILLEKLQGSVRRIDRVHRDRVGLLSGDDHESSTRIDVEAARLALGGRASEIRKGAARRVDRECSDRA